MIEEIVKNHLDHEYKNKKAKANTGEMCGVLTAQNIGEPATQITLNSVDYNTELVIDWIKNEECPPSRPNEKIGKFIVLPEMLTTSARKYRSNGVIKLQWIYITIQIMYRMNVSQDKMLNYYQRKVK